MGDLSQSASPGLPARMAGYGGPSSSPTSQPGRPAIPEPVRAYSFDLRDIVAVIPRDMLSGALPASPRLTLQLSPDALDSTRHYLTTTLGTIWRACPLLFAQPVSPAADRTVVLVRPSEGIVSPFRIAGAPPATGAAPTIPEPVRAGVLPPYLQETTHFGQSMPMPGPEMPMEPVNDPGTEGIGSLGTGSSLFHGSPFLSQGAEPPLNPFQERSGPEPVGQPLTAESSPFLAALRQGVPPVAPTPPVEVESGRQENVVTFTLAELFGHFTRETLPFDPSVVSPGWKVNFPAEFITRQLPSGRVVTTLARILEWVSPEARAGLAAFAGNEAELTIPLRDVFERLPLPQKRVMPTEPQPEATPEPIFAETPGPGAAGGSEGVFPGRFEPHQTVLEPVVPPQEDLADAPEYAGPIHAEPGGAEEVASLDDLEDAQPALERDPRNPPSNPAVRERSYPEEVDGLPSRDVPDFSGLGFAAEPVADLELRAIFASQEVFTPQKAVEQTVGLPGVEGAVLFRRRGDIVAAVLAGDEPGRRLGQQAPAIFNRIQDLATELGFAGSEVFTLNTGRGIVSFFGQGQSCLAILHGRGMFAPGMREKLMLIARGMASLLREE